MAQLLAEHFVSLLTWTVAQSAGLGETAGGGESTPEGGPAEIPILKSFIALVPQNEQLECITGSHALGSISSPMQKQKQSVNTREDI